MPGEFPYDVFLSHSAKDQPVVRDVAERLKKDGLQPASQLSTINTQLPTGTFRFRDPLNKERRFLPLRSEFASHTESLCVAIRTPEE